jgi:hypothetical protein
MEALRREHGRSASLFITDRCPARAESPAIIDFELFEQILEWLAMRPDLELISITGGEPFVERRGLALSTRRLGAAGKQVAVYTSGVWAASGRVPGWIHDVLARCDCVVLNASTDDDALINAAREITAAEAWLVMQVTDAEGARERTAALLTKAFGGRWDQHAEINVIAPVRYGRSVPVEGRSFGPCQLLRSPVIRYDGAVSACSNDGVTKDEGPARLRRAARSAAELDAALTSFRADMALRVIDDAGFGSLTRHPALRELGGQRFSTNCELCWKALDRLPTGSDRALDTLTPASDEQP